MNAARQPDVIVVGAGIVGAACALAASRRGCRVTVLDAAYASAGTTSAGMGHLVVMDDSPAQLALTSYALRLWRELGPQLGPSCEADPCGTLWVAEDDAQAGALAAKHALYASAGVESELLDAQQLREVEPNLREGLAGALRVPGDKVVYPPTVTLQLLELARELGARVETGVRVDALVDHGVRCGSDVRRAGAVVNAAGAAAATLTPELPIVPRKGHLAITDRYPGCCRHQLVELGYLTSAHVMTSESVAFNVQPRATGQILIGSSRELVGFAPAVNHKILNAMLARAVAFMPSLARLSVIRCWTGFRPATPDKLPLIGAWDATAGLWIAAGHEGLGITTSLATGELLADQLAGAATAIDATPFLPSRVHAEANA